MKPLVGDFCFVSCPDCGAQVIDAESRDGQAYVEPDPQGKVGLCCFGEAPERPTTVRIGYAGQERFKRHRCSRRAKSKELPTIHRVYAEQEKAPEIQVAISELGGDAKPGDHLTLHDGNGNQVRAEVTRVVVAVRPDWSTYSTKVERDQPTLEEAR